MVRDDRRKQIMRVVEKLAANRRYHEITLEEVAEAAQVGKGTIYHYFKDKDDLFFQVATSGFDELCCLLEQEVPENTSFDMRLNTICENLVQFFGIRWQLLQIMQNQAAQINWADAKIREEWMQKRKKLAQIIAQVLAEGADAGIIRNDISTEVLAAVLLNLLRSCTIDWDASLGLIRKREILLDLFLNGVCRPQTQFTTHNIGSAINGFNGK